MLEGYGLTETTGAITLNTPASYSFGSVGKPLGHTEIRFAPDGEILVKSAKVMTGYFNDKEASAQAMTADGFFKTGDIGHMSQQGFLTITDRKRDLIKTAQGKFVAPQKLTQLFSQHPLVSNVLIHGESEKYIVALLTLHEPLVLKIAKDLRLSFQDYNSLLRLAPIQKIVRDIVAAVNAAVASHETVKNFAILSEDFSIENGELTPSLKVRRKYCDEKFRSVISKLY